MAVVEVFDVCHVKEPSNKFKAKNVKKRLLSDNGLRYSLD